MAINIIVQYNGGLLPDIIILLTQGHYHRGTRLNAMRGFVFAAYKNSTLLLPCLVYIISVLFLLFV